MEINKKGSQTYTKSENKRYAANKKNEEGNEERRKREGQTENEKNKKERHILKLRIKYIK